jgi:Cu+-exporting ATPase
LKDKYSSIIITIIAMSHSNNYDNNNILLSIDGMMCQNNCGTTVHNALQSVMGVQSVKVSFPAANANITLSPTCTISRDVMIQSLINAAEGVGFDACSMNQSTPSYVLTIIGMMCQKNCGNTVQKALLSVSCVYIYA